MKVKILLLIGLFSCGLSFSQVNKMRERIRSQKIAFITDQLQLTSEEAQAFWPVFNAYESEVEKIKNGELRSIRQDLRSNEDLSDQEAKQLLQRLVTAENNLHELRVGLVSDLQTVLSPQKILRLKVADEEFNKQLLERLREMRQKRSNRNKP
jgi:Spy/CpxP family protein refolding chaperone